MARPLEPCSIWLAPSAPSACRAPPGSVKISRLTSAQSHCVSFCRMCRTTRFLFRGGGTSRRLEASCRPVRCAAAGCLLSVNVQASHCLSKQKSRHPSIPVAMQRADMPVDGWRQRRIFGTISPTRPAERTGRLQVCAATMFCCCQRPSFMLEAQFLAGQAVASANTRTVAELAALPPRGSSEGRCLRRLCLCLRVSRS